MTDTGDGPTGLNGLLRARTEDDLFRAAVDAAGAVLDPDSCKLAVAEDDVLVLRATSSPSPAEGGRDTLPIAHTIPGKTYTSGESCLVADLADVRSASASESKGAPEVEYRSLLCVPLDGIGVLLAACRAPGAFDEADVEVTERLAAITAVVHADVTGSAPADAGEDRVEEIASVLSHDVRNPLQTARGQLELIEGADEERLDRIAVALDRIESLVDGVVTLVRTGERVDATDAVDLARAARQAWSMIDTGDATLEVDETATVEADEERLHQLLENLLGNAVTHGGDDVVVRVGIVESGDGFYVEDSGPGIPPEDRDRVFDRGFSTAARTGLGLSIVERIAAAHGWTVEVGAGVEGGARIELSGVELS